jgi:hypothetical protein
MVTLIAPSFCITSGPLWLFTLIAPNAVVMCGFSALLATEVNLFVTFSYTDTHTRVCVQIYGHMICPALACLQSHAFAGMMFDTWFNPVLWIFDFFCHCLPNTQLRGILWCSISNKSSSDNVSSSILIELSVKIVLVKIISIVVV